jgi:glycosyltransferase involved in cell wall biosynthesis
MEKTPKYRILTSYYRPKPGGFCKRYFRAINALLARGHTVHYLAIIEYPINHENCHFHRFPWPQGFTDNLLFWATLHLLSPLLLLIIGLRYNITHTFAFHPSYSLFLQPVRLIKKVPLTVFYRADHIISHVVKTKPCWLIKLELLIERAALYHTRVFCVSEILTQSIRERTKSLPDVEINTFPNNIDRIEVVHVPDHAFRLACIGHLEIIKNQQLAIRTARELATENIRLDIYGSGPCLGRLKELVEELGIGHVVRFHGWVEPEYILPRVDLLLMPSLREGAPNALLECIGAGIPVLASDIPEFRSLLPQQQLVSSTNTTEWSGKITCILQNKERLLGEMVSCQNQQAQNLEFDWDEAVTRHILSRQL